MLIQLIIIQVITFVIIIVFLRKLLYTETTKESDRLKKLRDDFFLKEKELQSRIELAGKEAEGKAEKAEEDAREYLRVKEKEAEEMKQSVISKARDQAEEMIRTAVNSKAKIREEIELEVKKNVPGAAVRIFKEALPQAAIEMIHGELVQEMVDIIKKMERGVFKTRVQKGELLAPYPIRKAEKERIVSALSERAGYDISLTEREDKGLVAGIAVKLGSLVIDGSLENKLRQVKMRD